VIASHLGYAVPNPRRRKRRLLVQSNKFDHLTIRPTKITSAEMREQGVRGLLMYHAMIPLCSYILTTPWPDAFGLVAVCSLVATEACLGQRYNFRKVFAEAMLGNPNEK
jgi:hypothetical protein